MVDQKKIEEVVYQFLIGIGEDPEREGLRETPARVSRMCAELFDPPIPKDEHYINKVFNATSGGFLNIIKDIPIYSFCEHHIMPFFGKAHIGYYLDGKVIGLSKIYREVGRLASGLNVQEELTQKILDTFVEVYPNIRFVIMIEATHLCVAMRGVKIREPKFITMKSTSNLKENELEYFLKCVDEF